MPYKDPNDPRKKASAKARKKRYRQRHPEQHSAEVGRWAKKYPEKKNGINRACKERHPEQVATRRKNRRLQVEFGISLEEYEAMFIAQNGVCAICREPETKKVNGKRARLHVDHNHLTGKLRKLLCSKHNLALGLFGDDPALLRAAADYLEKERG